MSRYASFCWRSLQMGCDTAGFKRSYMALDSEGQRKRDRFFTDSGIAVLRGRTRERRRGHDGSRRSSSSARYLSTESGRKVRISAVYRERAKSTRSRRGSDRGFRALTDNAEEPYQAGEYACRLYLNGELESELSFPILYPSCPIAPIESGFRCAGFVLDGQTCAGATGDACVCGPNGLWDCP